MSTGRATLKALLRQLAEGRPRTDVAGVVPQDALQLLGRQPATEPSPRVLLGSLDERLAEALVQAVAALLIGVSRPAFSSSTQSRVAAPGRPVRVPSCEESGASGAEPGAMRPLSSAAAAPML